MVLLVMFSLSQAQNESRFGLLNQTNSHINVSYTHDDFMFETIHINGQEYTLINDNEATPILKAGAPDLPKVVQSVIIPNKGKASISYDETHYVELQDILIAPSKGNLKRNVKPSDIPYTFGAEYSENKFYPENIVTLNTPYILRDYRGAVITVSPYQYNPVTKTLRIYHNLNATVHINSNEIGANELELTSTLKNKTYHKVYDKHFLNAEYYNNLHRYTPIEEIGNMLIITKDEYADEIQPLVDWKIQRGLRTTVVNVSSIGNDQSSLASYVSNAYAADPNLVFVLLVGDHSDVKSYNFGTASTGETNWSDTAYTYLTGNDKYPELLIGRLSGESSDDITVQVNRILEYEKTPLASEYYKNGIGLASNEGAGNGDDGEADWEHSRNLGTKLKAYGFNNYFEFYDGSQGGDDADGNPNPTIITPKLEEGASLFFYTGHGDQGTCISGNFGGTDINATNNNGKYPVVISVACNNGSFTSGTCISEDWLRASNGTGPTGAITATGSSILMAWAPPMETQDEMVEILTEAYANNKKYTIGGVFYNSQLSCLDNYPSANTGQEIMDTWVFFGDPSTPIRIANPLDLTVNHSTQEDEGISNLVVNCDTDGTLVAVTQNGVVLGTGIVTGQTVDVSFTAGAITSTDDLMVTATKYNYRPYQENVSIGNLSVGEFNKNSFSLYPNPTNGNTTIKLLSADTVTVSVVDLLGKQVYNTGELENVNAVKVNTKNYASGTYFVKVSNASGISVVKKLVVNN